jgi:hypothetical protein
MGLSPAQQEQLKTVLEGLKPLATPAAPGQPRVNIPGQVGGAPGQLVGQPAGVQPQGVLGLPTTGGTATTGSAPPARTPLPASQFVGTPLPQPAGPTTPGGATVYGAVQNITAVLNAHKEKEDQRLTRRAEVLTRSLQDAIDRRDAAAIDEILTPANKAILKKAGIGEPPEIRETTPEEKGVMNGLKHKIVTTPTAGEQATSLQQQRGVVEQQAALSAEQKDPKLAAAQALKTTLSGDEIRMSEMAANGLVYTEAQKQADAAKMEVVQAQLASDLEIVKTQGETTVAAAKINATSREEVANIRNDLQIQVKSYQDDLASAKLALQEAQLEQRGSTAAVTKMSALADQSARLADAFEKAGDPDQAKAWRDRAAMHLDNVQKFMPGMLQEFNATQGKNKAGGKTLDIKGWMDEVEKGKK